MIDTPGIRSFGLAHIAPDDVVMAFSDLADAIEDCPRGCGHMGPPADPECALDALSGRRPTGSRRPAGCWPCCARLSATIPDRPMTMVPAVFVPPVHRACAPRRR